jgi:hypothetical protein
MSRSESSAAVCEYATPISQPHQAWPVDLSDAASWSDRRAATEVETVWNDRPAIVRS